MSVGMPSTAQIALALIVLKSKPTKLSVEGYFELIQLATKNRSRKLPVTNHHYIDGTHFWKQAFERSDSDNNKLLDRIFELEQMIEHGSSPVSSSPPGPSIPSKRKPEDAPAVKANTQSKRRRIGDVATSDDIDYVSTDKMTTVHRNCPTLVRAFNSLRMNIKNEEITSEALLRSINELCNITEQSTTTICRSGASYANNAPRMPTVEELCRVMCRTWTLISKGALQAERRTVKDTPLFVPSMVGLFIKILGQIQQFCLDEADRQIKFDKHRTKTPVSGAQSPGSTKNGEPDESQLACEAMSRSCCHMLSALDLNCNTHINVFRGLTCALLDHIGSCISLLTFAEASKPIRKQIGIEPPRGLLDVTHIDSQSALRTSQIAGRYLVPILKTAVAKISKMEDVQRSRLLQLDSSLPAVEEDLLTQIQKTLQKTLLRSVYDDDDSMFEDALERSEEIDYGDPNHSSTSNEQVTNDSEWFIGQVWEQIGWDILSA